ncbi:hypothetical protein AVEN_17583-1 [Araneus ventricosus]|uniref:Uncharacterized protein n=1 Tax=Araneus ventricosus TaxID=182803 RepID=A0A4Y2K001_ARAVE|nr:hypothetical protein AVEN_17583-1 [Araneus ventricosus]
MVSASASEPVDREFYPELCSYSIFAIVCNASLLQVRPMVTSKLALTCCKLVSHLHSCRVKLAASLQVCSASLLQTKIAIWALTNSKRWEKKLKNETLLKSVLYSLKSRESYISQYINCDISEGF